MKQEKMDELLKQVAVMEEVPEGFNFDSKKVWDELDERLSKRQKKNYNTWYNFGKIAAALLFLVLFAKVYFFIGKTKMNEFNSANRRQELNDPRVFLKVDLSSSKESSSKLALVEIKEQELDKLINTYREYVAIFQRLNQEERKRIFTIRENPSFYNAGSMVKYNSLYSAYKDKIINKYNDKNPARSAIVLHFDTLGDYETFSRLKSGLNRFEVRDNRLGQFGIFLSPNAANDFEALSNGINHVGLLQSTIKNNYSDVLEVQTNGLSSVGYMLNTNAANTANAFEVQTNGLGRVGFLQNPNAANTANAFEVHTNGLGRVGILLNTNSNKNSNVIETQIGFGNVFEKQGYEALRLEEAKLNQLSLYYNSLGNLTEIISPDSLISRLKYLPSVGRFSEIASGNYERPTADYMKANDLNSLNSFYLLGNADRQVNYFTIQHPEVSLNNYNIRLLYNGDDMQVFKLGASENMQLENSSERIILYGDILTDSSGKAKVKLPSYLDNPNLQFHYQLTVSKSMAKAVVSKEISKLSFEIISSKPNVKVNWLVFVKKVN